jgi:hypothetical protein
MARPVAMKCKERKAREKSKSKIRSLTDPSIRVTSPERERRGYEKVNALPVARAPGW